MIMMMMMMMMIDDDDDMMMMKIVPNEVVINANDSTAKAEEMI